MFKRRDKRPVWKVVFDALYPKGGWSRAFQYIKFRVKRLPDSPEKVARGIWAGVFTTFTPLYGVHFFIAVLIARLSNGNILASLLGTFFGNPLTYIPIGVVSMQTGHFLLGTKLQSETKRSFIGKFIDAWRDLQDNFIAFMTGQPTDWSKLVLFYHEVFFPYLVGGILPGMIAATVCYYLCIPLVRAYQNRRKGVLLAKLAAMKKKATRKNDRSKKSG